MIYQAGRHLNNGAGRICTSRADNMNDDNEEEDQFSFPSGVCLKTLCRNGFRSVGVGNATISELGLSPPQKHILLKIRQKNC